MKTTTTTKENSKTVRKLVYCGLLIAIGIILKFVGEISLFGDTFRISLVYIPMMFAGMVLGPVGGFAVGFLSDLLQFFIRPEGNVFHLGFTLTNGLYGMIPGLIYLYLKKKNPDSTVLFNLKWIFITALTCEIICALILNSVFLYQLMGDALIAMMPARVIKIIAMILVNTIIINLIYKPLVTKLKT